jgi:hypothetical protein
VVGSLSLQIEREQPSATSCFALAKIKNGEWKITLDARRPQIGG